MRHFIKWMFRAMVLFWIATLLISKDEQVSRHAAVIGGLCLILARMYEFKSPEDES